MKKIFPLVSLISLASVAAIADTASTGMRENITGMEIAAEMSPGANLWNTLDAHGCNFGLGDEGCWGNPITTLEMISDISDRGFKTLRIPVTWYNHMGPGPDFVIDSAWLDRVEEVANYAFTNDMYVIINIHHDDYKPGEDKGKWLSPLVERKEQTIDQLEKVWTQIAERFKDYGDYLIFETMNEPRAVDTPQQWSGGTPEHRAVINQLNLAAVNAIRATGGNNASRFIMTPQYGAHGGAAISDLVIPNNDERIIVSIHNYHPFPFTLQSIKDGGTDEWGSTPEKAQLIDSLKVYHEAFTSKGQAVVLGEWGAANKDNIEARVKYYEVFSAASKAFDITPIAWIYSYQRRSRTWNFPALEDAIMNPPMDALELERITIPGKVEAESYYRQLGINTEQTEDVGGGSVVGFIENGDYVEFDVAVAETADYKFNFRVSSAGAGGKIAIVADDIKLAEATVPFTGDWQVFTNVDVSAHLNSGKQTLRLVFSGPDGFLFNLNWLDISQIGNSPTNTPTPTATPAPTFTPTPEPTPLPVPKVTCEHVVLNSWGTTFQGAIKLHNNSDEPVSGWTVNWSYSDSTEITSSWNANITGSYTATDLGWNSTINPGSTVEFGFIANGDANVSDVTGDVCH
ncbi:cellulase family glycosylhydrolase [Agarilytica rhodophyticola]|uniref:cellulase family glycosylhydrolase n=1 Tax=Agarilytica rhodophyticola TaxID=1737490 RepID=UPI000B348511|nr:cellulase family glycosylhydrolase [Agarilytica rhodophyticola]